MNKTVELVNKYLNLGADKFAEAIYQAIYTDNSNNKLDNWLVRLQEELNQQYASNIIVNKLKSSLVLNACPTVKLNVCGKITKLIQERLKSVGFNIIEDGVVGKNTWQYLLSGKKY